MDKCTSSIKNKRDGRHWKYYLNRHLNDEEGEAREYLTQ